MGKIKSYLIENKLLMEEWDYEANVGIDPAKVAGSSGKSYWWKCKKCGYKWQAKVGNRSILNRGCPCCANKVVVPGKNDLSTTHPDVAKEWHPTKNETLTPRDVVHGTGNKVWWKCSICGKEYQATVLHRTNSEKPTGCPNCNAGRQLSRAEQAVFYYVKKAYPDAINNYKADFLGRSELDIYIPSMRCAIEYDGEAWHTKLKNKLKHEQEKYRKCQEQGIKLFRLREKMAPPISDIADKQFSCDEMYEPKKLEPMIRELLAHISFFTKHHSIDINIERDYNDIMRYRTPLKKDSLAERFPEVAKEWHPTKNRTLLPTMFKPGSDDKVWWKCSVCGNEYQAIIGKRTVKNAATGCPICGRKRTTLAMQRKVNMLDPDTKAFIKTFDSITEAAKSLNLKTTSNITSVCKGNREKAGGYKWEYAE